MTAQRLGVRWLFVVLLALPCLGIPCLADASQSAKVFVVLWFDTEDYLLPASDDAALRLAEFLSGEGIRATFKVVGEKARTLKRRKRYDVVEALKKHEIGYHSNWHSVQPSPAMYLSDLGWDDGVAEFERRERPGRDDVEKIFGQAPTCYGQPGSSWAPQSFGAMRRWQMPVYLDAGSHLGLDGKPHYYCGILTLYKLTHTLRTGLAGDNDLREAEDRFRSARDALRAEGGGIVSIFYHPCEFVHKEFWDGVNFRAGANPPPEKWKQPPQKTAAESATAWRTFEAYIRFIRGFDEVRFVTASEAAQLYRDRARGRPFTADEIKAVAARVTSEVTFQRHDDFALAASETFVLLNQFVAAGGKTESEPITLNLAPFGPAEPRPPLVGEQTVDWSQFVRTASDVTAFVRQHNRVPSTVWLGSAPVPPDSYLVALAEAATAITRAGKPPESVTLRPARLAAAAYVSDDRAELWSWVIFPPGFRAPAMMELARRQAWTIKPAILAE
ncbi:MAG TPA: hypothetical protein VG826_02730 [Pirellulales bacterium]|nr:hypothetical protein [Pirellulales bacterium]